MKRLLPVLAALLFATPALAQKSLATVFAPTAPARTPVAPVAQPHAWLSGVWTNVVRQVNTDTFAAVDTQAPLRNAEILGLAFNPNTGLMYARVMPGNLVYEYDLAYGRLLRSIALPVMRANCGLSSGAIMANPDFGENDSYQECGLAIRWSDGHLFFNAGPLLYEMDQRGRTVRSVALPLNANNPGGLGYDQRRGTIWMLNHAYHVITEMDLRGRVLRQHQPRQIIGTGGLDHDPFNDELAVTDPNGVELILIEVGTWTQRRARVRRGGQVKGIATGEL